MPNALRECEGCSGIIQEIESVTVLLASPIKFLEKVGMNILWHHKEITGDIKQAASDWETGNYIEFGQFCGKIVKIATKATMQQSP